MSDNFNNFEKHNIQINVFHVKDEVKGDKDTKNKLPENDSRLKTLLFVPYNNKVLPSSTSQKSTILPKQKIFFS